MMSSYSIVDWHGGHEGYRCGYCKSSDSNYSDGMTAYKLTVEDYQDLIDRGWRRSGTYVYKPTMKKTCCPQYPIRCDALAFRLSKSQKKVVKRVNKYLSYGVIPGKHELEEDHYHPDDLHPVGRGSAEGHQSEVPSSFVADMVSGDVASTSSAGDSKISNECKQHPVAVGSDPVKAEKLHVPKPGVGKDPSKPECKKAKLRRLEKKNLKAGKQSTAVSTADASLPSVCPPKVTPADGKTLEDYLGEVIENPAHKLEIRVVRSSPPSTEFEQTCNESYLIYKKYQMVIHKEDESECAHFMYDGFLVESPLQAEAGGNLPLGYGSFHQLYILDGRVIAVGVIDILPRCVSSVYLYYDPEFNFLSLGTYSALRELAFVRELHGLCPDIRYYYLGFYIHSCPKMRYKGQYSSSYLLCPESYTWHEIENCRKKLDEKKYSRFAENGIDDKERVIDINEVFVLHQRQAMPYEVYKSIQRKANDKKAVTTYAKLVGMTCARRILLYRP